MKECEFKKECDALFSGACNMDNPKNCTMIRKFAILVRNRAIEDAVEIWPGTLEGLKALKIKESP